MAATETHLRGSSEDNPDDDVLLPSRRSAILATVCLLIAFRVMLGYQPHSGQDDWHGLEGAYGGDFEAQRHWMEITFQLPMRQWYWYDLSYWGLDYPPLSAYASYLCGWASEILVGPASVALDESRGFEDPTHKAFMRATVIFFEMIVYATAVWYWSMMSNNASKSKPTPYNIKTRNDDENNHETPQQLWQWRQLVHFAMAMMQPAILLIDHGHFQYNTVSLGFSLWAFLLISDETNFTSCVWGSICFCLALSFKQMTLYYAPTIFCYLLGRCFRDRSKLLTRFVTLGVTVVLTFAVVWAPVLVVGPPGSTFIERTTHILRRIIPLQRGLFEGKVSNLWCALSTKPINIRDRIPARLLPRAALATTVALMTPACIRLFQLGATKNVPSKTATTSRRVGHLNAILFGMTASALSFFLASFQVHEKSLLMAVAPASLLWQCDFDFWYWFSLVSTWTLWPLLVLDRLQVAYVCTVIVFTQIVGLMSTTYTGAEYELLRLKTSAGSSFFEQHKLLGHVPLLSWIAMGALHILEMFITPPSHLPDIYPVLWSIVGCGFCCLAWVVAVRHMWEAKPKQA